MQKRRHCPDVKGKQCSYEDIDRMETWKVKVVLLTVI